MSVFAYYYERIVYKNTIELDLYLFIEFYLASRLN